MTRTSTAPNRLKGLLPPWVLVAHKSGTSDDFAGINGCTNDAGIVTLPEGRGHVAIAVMIRGSSQSLMERERSIARAARAVYEHWTIQE